MYHTNTSNNFLCPHQVFEDPKFKKMPLSSRYLYTVLCKLANRNSDEEGWFYQSISQLAELSKMNIRTVIRAKQILKEKEFIDIRRGYYQHSKKRTYDYFKLNGFRFKARK